MTNLREAAQMALEALENHRMSGLRLQAIPALRAALAQPDKEWVGLSKAEREEISQKHKPYVADIMAAHEEELKRRNT